MQVIETFKTYYYGGIYSDTYEEFSDGGPKCAAAMENQFRITVSAISATINCLIIYLAWNKIKNSRELDLKLVKNLKPSLFEKCIGFLCFATYIVMASYKFYTGRGVFMHNPCHYVLLFSGILLTTEKTKVKAVIFVSYIRWLYGPITALVFPVTNGMVLPWEEEFFWIEHYLAAFIGPLCLTLCGRYGFFKMSFWDLLVHQYFGFAIHILYMRFIMVPQSMLTWANLNFTLCHPECDPLIPLIGDYYFYLADHYLNFASFLTVLFQISAYGIIMAPVYLLKSIFKKKQD
ncbi:hypothetical protein ABPG72_005612 [Tetrahymena utriculariae]